MDRRLALRTLATAALATVATPAFLRRRYTLFAQGQQYSARTIRLMQDLSLIHI